MHFFERQNTITRNLSKKSSDQYYQTNYGKDSNFSSKSDTFENDNFDKSMRETKMEFFFTDSEAKQRLKPPSTHHATATNFFSP